MRVRGLAIAGAIGILTFVSSAASPASIRAATPSFVQMRANEVSGGKTNNVTFAQANTAGNLIVVSVLWSNSASVTVADTRGNSYASAAPRRTWGSSWSEQTFFARNVAGGTNRVTATFATTIKNFGVVYAHEYAGIDKVNPVDATIGATGTAAAMSSGSATTTVAGDLLYAVGGSTLTVTAAGAGWTTRSTASGNRTQDRLATAPGPYSATSTQNGTAWVMQLIAFRPATTPPDTAAPSVPTGLGASAASTTQVNLSWVASTDNVGVTGYRVFRDGTPVATPAATTYQDTNLAPGTTYTYKVSAYDAAGNESAQSASASATTQSPPIDTTAPVVSLTAPAGGATVTGTLTVSASASDNVGVVGVRFLVDGVDLGTEDTTAPYSVSWATTTATDGPHALTARARDAAGNVTLSSSTSVTVSNAPPPIDTTAPVVSLTAPAGGATVTGTLTVSASASDNVGVVGVRFLVDGVDLGTEDTTAPYSVSWATTTATDGPHALTARARDAAGNVTLSSSTSVTVSNAPPPSGLVAAYAFDDGFGTSAADASGQGINGTLASGASWAAGKYGSAVSLDGSDDYVELGNPTALRLTGSMTLSAWINSSAFPGDDAAVVSKRGSTGFQLDTTIDTGPRTVGFKLNGSTGADMIRYGVTPMQTNTWYHIAGVYDTVARTMTVYLDGQVEAGPQFGNVTSTQLDSPQNVHIGRRSFGGYLFGGRIDDVRIYDRALTAAEIQADMAHGLGPPSGDATPPTVAITAPLGGTQVTDIVNVTAAAADDIGVLAVQFYVDGVPAGGEDSTAPYELAWNTRATANGAHTLTARARDATGNNALSAGVAVNVVNGNLLQNEVLAAGFDLPTNIEFLPDGRMLVVELAGKIRILPPPYTTPEPTPFLQITNIGSAGVQQGIYDIVLDPAFATNHFYYVFYTLGTPNRDQVTRFTANSTLSGTVTGSETVIYVDPGEPNAEHHGGAIAFDNDGKLLITTGEHFNPPLAQDLTSPRGKIHRINKDGTIPTDNPFFDGAGPNVDSIWALGLRNPFRAFYDAPTGRLYVGDVGGNDPSTAIEEVNVGAAGANYGWPDHEGPCPAPCTSPLYTYQHNGRDASITGGFVYRGTQFPSSYQGDYFFADYTQNWIRRLDLDANGNVLGVANFEPADGSADGPYGDIVHLTEGPDGALYYVDLGYTDGFPPTIGVSKIRRIRSIESNQAPIAVASANPTSGVAPLTVTFSSVGSIDPEGQSLTYAWDFGDLMTSTAPAPVHTYTTAGRYTARLTVSDGVSQTVASPITISAGNLPVPSIGAPTDGAFFTAGDVISFSGTATDVEDGTLPASAFTWNIDFLHAGHVHPGTPVTGVKSGAFTIPTTGHDFSGNTRYRITLTVVDSSGLASSTAVTIWPRKVNLTFTTVPGTLTLYLDGIARAAPFVYDALVGFTHTIEARDQALGGTNYTFASWSDGGTRQHTIVAPGTDQTYSATYTASTSIATPSFVQVNAATPQTPQGTVTVAYLAAQTTGNTNIVAIGWSDATAAITSVTDASGNAYQVAAPTARGIGMSQAIYYARNISAAAGGNTVTVVFNGSVQYADVRITEYGGLDPTNPFDTSASASGSSTTASSGNLTTSFSVELVFGAGYTSGGFTASGAGFTTRIITVPDTDIVNDRVVNGIGSYAATATQSGNWIMQAATFRAAGQ